MRFYISSFWRLNSQSDDEKVRERLQSFSQRLGFTNADDLANRIDEMKKKWDFV